MSLHFTTARGEPFNVPITMKRLTRDKMDILITLICSLPNVSLYHRVTLYSIHCTNTMS